MKPVCPRLRLPTFHAHTRNVACSTNVGLRLFCLFAAISLAAFVGLVAPPPVNAAGDPFEENVRTTPWRNPAEEQATFKVPPGFEIQLVAAEPDINKPMNLAFDAIGRLWVTTSTEYPYIAPTNRAGRDRLMIFEDFGPDGRARKITQFATDLNIPIGVYPFQSRNPDGQTTWKAIVWSIPNIWLLEDTDGDNKADKRTLLYGPFDVTRDTHGNQASFRRGYDGWLYATHGYNNDSHVRGRDGHQVDLNSGNTYRIRLDGTRIEHFTHGQVNPFGLAFDPLGNLFSSDCHSEPLYQLLVDGYYPSFGKPHDGLGFAPNMMERIRGSTAIDGISIYADDLWPAEFRGNFFFGDVMASRVSRDLPNVRGATVASKGAPDFVATDDPWFRPVDTTLGPDGALYVADFYNRIIGHYEVPLAHPGRDRTSGRIWRVVYRDKALHPVALASDLPGLIRELGSPSLPRRMLAMNAIADRFGRDAVSELKTAAAQTENSTARVHALWLLQRLGAMESPLLLAASKSGDPLVRVHVQRMAGDLFYRAVLHTPGQPDPEESLVKTADQIVRAGLTDKDALVLRCAAESAGHRSIPRDISLVKQLLELHGRVDTADTHLDYVVRKAIRDQLKVEGVFGEVLKSKQSPADEAAITEVAISIPNAEASTWLLRQLPTLAAKPNANPPVADVLKHAARHAPEDQLGGLVNYASGRIPAGTGSELLTELERQFALFRSVDDGLQQRGAQRPESVRAWGTNLVWRFFTAMDGYHSWTALPLDAAATAVPWDLETRNSTDGRKRRLTSSLPHGETLTGILRSPEFVFPGELNFWLAGHDGFPAQPAKKANFVRLRAADSGETLAVATPPRNDVARRIQWRLPELAQRKVYVEAVDGDTGTAYAWIAFGGFEPEVPALRSSEIPPRRMRDWIDAATETAVRVDVKEMAPLFSRMAVPQANRASDDADGEIRGLFAKAWLALVPEAAVSGLAKALSDNAGPAIYRENVTELLATRDLPAAQSAVAVGLKSLPYKAQEKLSYTLASARFSAETLLASIEAGAVSPRVLQRVGVNNRLKASQPKDWEARVARLTKGLAPADEAKDQLIAERRRGYAAKPGNATEGHSVFVKNCAPCHRIGTEGAIIGPQLNGIGQRGLERLCEDVLDPNRNIDRAFRSVLLTMKDGEVVSGLFRREEGETLILADSTGKELSVPRGQVVERRESEISLMPENFAETIPPVEFNNLMAFLLSKNASNP